MLCYLFVIRMKNKAESIPPLPFLMCNLKNRDFKL
jgi:hypothetical protein